MAVYTRYCLPSMKFSLHDLTNSNPLVLDRMTEQYLKKWLGIPKHGANTALLHISRGLNIPRISDVYRQAHSASYIDPGGRQIKLPTWLLTSNSTGNLLGPVKFP